MKRRVYREPINVIATPFGGLSRYPKPIPYQMLCEDPKDVCPKTGWAAFKWGAARAWRVVWKILLIEAIILVVVLFANHFFRAHRHYKTIRYILK